MFGAAPGHPPAGTAPSRTPASTAHADPDVETVTDPAALPDLPAWESITRSRRPDRPGVRGLLRVAAGTVVPLHGTGQGERDPSILPHAEKRYVKFDPPIPVRVTGSLFWDIEHPPPNTVGPTDRRPKTAWEIHPVTKIEFEP